MSDFGTIEYIGGGWGRWVARYERDCVYCITRWGATRWVRRQIRRSQKNRAIGVVRVTSSADKPGRTT